jgi:hypothetical protein
VKLTVTPHSGDHEPGTLADLAAMIERAQGQVKQGGGDPEQTRAKVLLTLGQKVKAVEVSW